MKVLQELLLLGPVDEVTGYGEISRQIAFGLNRIGIKVGIEAQNWSRCQINLNDNDRKRLKVMKNQQDNYSHYLYVNVPQFFRTSKGKLIAGYTMSEASGIPGYWVKSCNCVDLLFVPTSFNYETFQESGVQQDKLRIVPLGVDHQIYTPEGKKYPLRRSEALFTFLSVGEWVERKGFDLLIQAFVEEFSRADDVCLVLKCHSSGSDYDPTGDKILKEIKKITAGIKNTDVPPIRLIPYTLPSSEMPSLYRTAHCFVSPTRGEGWNMPVYEAIACGVPVITTKLSAHLDYLNQENSYLLEIEELEKIPSFNNPNDKIYHGFSWAKPSKEHLKYLMREVYEKHESEAKGKAKKALNMVRNCLGWNLCAQRIIEYISNC